VATRLNDQELTTYTADGVLVGTPTGSTAYSHAAGGPILHPEVQSLLLTPICAHPNPSGSLVMPANTVVTLTVRTDHEAALSIDGQEDVSMVDGDSVVVRVSPYTARFLRSQQRDYFYHTLLKKLRW
jgi:NAD+ kinase